MIKDNQRYFNRLHVVIDAVVICIAYVLAWIYKFLILKDQRGLTLAQYCVALIGIIPLYLCCIWHAISTHPKECREEGWKAATL